MTLSAHLLKKQDLQSDATTHACAHTEAHLQCH